MDRIDALRLFLDVVDTGTFSGVARLRSLATSTVTLAVNQLEDEFGVRLMVRSTRKLTLTHEGEILAEEARRLVADWDGAVSGFREDGPLSGPIRVSATNDFGRTRLRPLLDLFQELHPGVQLTLLMSDSAVDLLDEQVDLAIRSGPLKDSLLRARLLIRGPRLVCASPSYWDRVGRPGTPRDLVDHNCIVLARPGAPLATWPFEDGGRKISLKVDGDRTASDGDIVRQWAIEGRGVILKNAWDVLPDIREGRLEAVLEEYTREAIDLYAVSTPGRPSRRLTALIDFLAERLRTVPSSG